MKRGRHAAFENPLFYLAAYGITALWLPWLVSRGGLQDWRQRPVNEADFGDAESKAIAQQAFPKLRISNERVLR